MSQIMEFVGEEVLEAEEEEYLTSSASSSHVAKRGSFVAGLMDIAVNWIALPFLSGLFFRGFGLALKVRGVVAANKAEART
ncbi:hypothetical protein BC830DRAFT_1169328 [Chytriomyces sp. MP71]|nr:hypothetical protein BC830DRAFT_1169328 [Chytriomyces sp. MP71]